MNAPNPLDQIPVVAPQPWYTSPVQVAGVVAGLSQAASIVIRIFGLPVTDAQLDQWTADGLQLVTLAAGMVAIFKRQRSSIAPLTLTRKGADVLTEKLTKP